MSYNLSSCPPKLRLKHKKRNITNVDFSMCSDALDKLDIKTEDSKPILKEINNYTGHIKDESSTFKKSPSYSPPSYQLTEEIPYEYHNSDIILASNHQRTRQEESIPYVHYQITEGSFEIPSSSYNSVFNKDIQTVYEDQPLDLSKPSNSNRSFNTCGDGLDDFSRLQASSVNSASSGYGSESDIMTEKYYNSYSLSDRTSPENYDCYSPPLQGLYLNETQNKICSKVSDAETKRRQRQSKAFYEGLSDEERKERHRLLDNMRSKQYRNRRRQQKNGLMEELEREEKRKQKLENELHELISKTNLLRNIYEIHSNKRAIQTM